MHPWARFLLGLLIANAQPLMMAADETPAADRSLGPPFTRRHRAELGSADAKVVLIEVSDFRCEHCRLFHERVFPRIKARYIDTGLIRYVMLPAAAPKAPPAPELFGLARFALLKGRYWEVSPKLFAHSQERSPTALASRVGFDPGEVIAFLAEPSTQAAIAADQGEAIKLEIFGTPTFFLRQRTSDGNFVEARVDGYESWDYFDSFISELLRTPR